jgi:uncharacterized protein (TIGR02145 family)
MKNLSTITFLLIVSIALMKAEWKPGDPFVDERDGQTYKTVKIGNQVWMAENLNYGNIIPTTKQGYEMHNDGIVEKYCWDNEIANCDGTNGKMKRGGFYEWTEAMDYPVGPIKHPVRGICPEGWHIPSNAEWDILLGLMGGYSCYEKLVVGGGSGFDALMTGYRCTMTGTFRVSAMSPDTRTYFWSADQTDAQNTAFIEIGMNSFQVINFSKSVGLCLRCIMDEQGTSIDELGTEFRFNISPNPVSENATISFSNPESSNLSISIYNSLGVEVKRVDANILLGRSSIEITTVDLPVGIYYCTLNTGKEKCTKSFMVIK